MVPEGFRGSEVCHPIFRVDDIDHMERDAAQIAVQRVLIEGAPVDLAAAHPTSASLEAPPRCATTSLASTAVGDARGAGSPAHVTRTAPAPGRVPGSSGSSDPDIPTVTDDICPICMGGKHDAVQPADCPHQFCRACILSWFRRTCACPLCKVPCRVLRRCRSAPPTTAVRERVDVKAQVRAHSETRARARARDGVQAGAHAVAVAQARAACPSAAAMAPAQRSHRRKRKRSGDCGGETDSPRSGRRNSIVRKRTLTDK